MNVSFVRLPIVVALFLILGCSKAEPQPAAESIPNIKPGRAADTGTTDPGTKPSGTKGAMKPM